MRFDSKLPDVGTTIFTVMSRRAIEEGALNIGQGFPDYPIDPRLAQALVEAVSEGHNQYAPMEGVIALRELIAAKLGGELRHLGRCAERDHGDLRRDGGALRCHPGGHRSRR
jgi:aspartate/methionine/tyrosine aminotransferase